MYKDIYGEGERREQERSRVERASLKVLEFLMLEEKMVLVAKCKLQTKLSKSFKGHGPYLLSLP